MQDRSSGSGSPDLRWLAAGALAGFLVAAWGLLQRHVVDDRLPAGAVARIGDRVITAGELDRGLDRLPSAPPPGQEDAAREWVLQRLVEDELLVRRGIELGIPESDPAVRDAIVQSLVASVTAEADAADPGDDELRAFLQANAERYTYANAVALDAWVSDDESVARAGLEALGSGDALPGTGLARVDGLPDTALPLERLRMFVGPAIAAAAADMPVGSSALYARQGRWYVVRVNGHDVSSVADLDAVRSQVLLDYRRKLADERLREYVAALARATDVVVAAP